MTGVLIKRTEYKVELVEETSPPEGLDGGNWFRYVVGEGKARIEGKKPGTMASVKKHAETFAKELNERGARGGSTFRPKSKQTTDKKAKAS